MSEFMMNYDLAHKVSARLMDAGIRFGVYSGAHAALLAGHREVNDIDIWADERQIDLLKTTFPDIELRSGDTPAPGAMMSHEGFMIRFGANHEVCVMGASKDYIDGQTYNVSFAMAEERIRLQTLGSLTTYFVDPVDTLLIKALMQRGRSQGKHDIDDILAINNAVEIDKLYLVRRVAMLRAEQRVIPLLARLGVLDADCTRYE